MNEMFLEYEAASASILETGKRLYNREMVAGNDGNISCRLSNGNILITAAGVSKGYMTQDMLVEIDFQGKILRGDAKPSSETSLHMGLYLGNAETGAVVHAHPPYATAFACSGKSLNIAILPEAIVNLGQITLLPYYHPGSTQLAESVSAYAYSHRALLLANHGALTWGKDLKTALFRMESLEHYARVLFYAQQLGEVKPLSRQSIEELEKLYLK